MDTDGSLRLDWREEFDLKTGYRLSIRTWTNGEDQTVTQPTNGTVATPTGLTMTSAGGDKYTATMKNGQQYSVRQEEWSVKTDYYLDAFVYNLPDLVEHVTSTGNKLKRILEIGIARGVLSIGMALLTDDDTAIVGVDIEENAKLLATENAALNGVASKIDVRIGDFFEPVLEDELFDLIFGELPFIPVDPALRHQYIADGHSSEILNISGGANGRDLVDTLITQGPRFLNSGGALLLIQPSFIGVERTMELLVEQGLEGRVLVSQEWLLDDTKFTRQSRGYIEGLNPLAFPKNAEGRDVFHLTIIMGVKN
ncbi:MAG: methyltransferase [Pseudonocardiaceae bacterium]